MNKIIKKSSRGLTFSLPDLKIGSYYHYIIDKSRREIHIIPDKNGNMTVSRKICGKKVKPLIDIRSSEVKKLVSEADYIELNLLSDGSVLVKSRKKIKEHNSQVISLKDLLGSCTSEFIIPAAMLKVSGECNYPDYNFGKPTLAENAYYNYLQHSIPYDKKVCQKSIKKVYKVISLFSGAGMFDKAFMDGRFKFVYGIDNSPAAVETYKANIGNHVYCKDIQSVDAADIPDADIAIGGPCCQAYSKENRHNSNTDIGEAKRLLIDDYIRLVKAKKVKVWVLENVPDLLTKKEGYYFNRICNNLSDYEITATIIDDSEVGGYSIRRRAIVIGSKIGNIKLPQGHVNSVKTVRDALSKVDASWFNFKDVTTPKADTIRKMSYIPAGGNWKDIPEDLNTYGPNTHSCIMKRLEWDKPSITLSNFRKSNILHPEENRILTVSEAAAIMGLEKDFKFLGTLSEKQQMVANGITQAIGKLIKNTILKALDTSNIISFA